MSKHVTGNEHGSYPLRKYKAIFRPVFVVVVAKGHQCDIGFYDRDAGYHESWKHAYDDHHIRRRLETRADYVVQTRDG